MNIRWCSALCAAVLVAITSLAFAQASKPASAQENAEAARVEFAKPLQEATDAVRASRWSDALTILKSVEALGPRRAYEDFIFHRLRSIAGLQAGDYPVAVESYQAVLAAGRLSADEEKGQWVGLAGALFNAKRFKEAADAAERALRAGAEPERMLQIVARGAYLAEDYPRAARAAQDLVLADERAARKPAYDLLQLLASAQIKQKDGKGYSATLEQIVRHHPKPAHWADLIYRVKEDDHFAQRHHLEAYRLLVATQSMSEASEYLDMADLLLRRGFPIEARQVLQSGFEAGHLGVGVDAPKHAELRAKADTLAKGDAEALGAPDGADERLETNKMFNQGYNRYIAGQVDAGLALMERAISLTGLKQSDDARLQLASAYIRAGRKEAALKHLSEVTGTDGAQKLARLWGLHLAR